MKIALRSPNWIGDCVMALPAIYALKKRFPESEITLVTKPYLKDFFLNVRELSEIVTIPENRSLLKTWKRARRMHLQNHDIGILFTNSFKSALIFRMAGIRNIVGYSRDGRGFLLRKRFQFPKNDRHHRFFYIDLINQLFDGDFVDASINILRFSKTELTAVRQKLGTLGIEIKRPIIGISPTAAYGTAKMWPSDQFNHLISRLQTIYPDIQVVLFGSEKEAQRIDRVVKGIDRNCYNLAGKLTLRESMAAISLCRLFISNDSGLMHLADALGIPLLGIFGPTIPHKTRPIGKQSEILFKKVSCSPCKFRECPIDHRCMTGLTVGMVLKWVREKLG